MKVQALFYLAAIALLGGCADEPPDWPKQRIVVIGDIHADINAARRAFQLADATNERDEWIGGDLVVVQLGDFIGRSYEDREVLDFILEMRKKAKAGGGRVHALIGNHEVFGARLELRWVPDEAYPAFSDIPGLDLDNPHLAELPEYKRARRMIVAHSVQNSITARCDDKVWAVDVGMSRYYGGDIQVLEIIGDDILSVIEY